MKEHPILFSSEMVRAILDDRKTQTRRICKDQIAYEYRWVNDCMVYPSTTKKYTGWAKDCGFAFLIPTKCPFGQVGDRLYIKESHKLTKFNRNDERWVRCEYRYEVDGDKCLREFRWKDIPKAQRIRLSKIRTWGKWRSSRFMYRFLARIFLEITNIRVERVQDINLDDCKSEGISDDPTEDWRELFKQLWDSLNAKRGYSWDKNPWVWCIEFKRKENP